MDLWFQCIQCHFPINNVFLNIKNNGNMGNGNMEMVLIKICLICQCVECLSMFLKCIVLTHYDCDYWPLSLLPMLAYPSCVWLLVGWNILRTYQDCKWCAAWQCTDLPRYSLLSECNAVVQYTCKCNVTYAHKESTESTDFHGTHKRSTVLCTDLL